MLALEIAMYAIRTTTLLSGQEFGPNLIGPNLIGLNLADATSLAVEYTTANRGTRSEILDLDGRVLSVCVDGVLTDE